MRRVTLSRDLLSGAVFVILGGLGLLLSRELESGTAGAMEAGYFPRLLSILLVVLGCGLAALSALTEGEAPEPWRLWPPALVTLATVAFALLLRPIGLVAAIFVTSLLASAAGRLVSLPKAFALATVLVLMNVGLFNLALGLPIPLWPRL